MHITAVVVTFNRKALLQECIGALLQQSLTPTDILVVDNSSTDGTGAWLRTQSNLKVVTQPNGGASGGVYTGIREACAAGADWVWIMDDDTIPEKEALAQLVAALQKAATSGDRFGFFVSKALWTDGAAHLMNLPHADPHFKGRQTLEWYQRQGIAPITAATFVSLLVAKEAVAVAGLPVKEMFIWADDQEYTMRLHYNGFKGAFVESSIVLHKTPVNYRSDLYADSASNLWKYRYGLRNELYIRRRYKGNGSFVRNVLKRFLIYPFRIMAKRNTARWPFIRVVWQSTWDALFFNPKPEKI